MIKRVSLSLAALAAMGIAGAASAQDTVGVDIVVDPLFAFAVDDANITLNLTGANAENSAVVASGISYNSNILVDLSATVSGSWPAVTATPGNELNFFIWGNTSNTSAANAAIVANSNAPAGAAAWNVTNNGASQIIGTNVPKEPVWGPHYKVVYGASAPNELPPPNTYSLTLTYTYAPS